MDRDRTEIATNHRATSRRVGHAGYATSSDQAPFGSGRAGTATEPTTSDGRSRRPPRQAERRPRVAALLTAALLATPGCRRGDDAPADVPRNVVLVVVDTLRADRLGCYGYARDTTPNIDALAETGTLYLDHRPQGVITISSMISMMTGLYVTGPEERLPEYRPTLAEVIRDAGFATVGIAGNQNLTDDRGFDRGFDHFERIRGGRGHLVVERFRRWYEFRKADAAKDGGFFAWLHIMDPHSPYAPDPDLRKRFSGPRPDLEQLLARWRSLYPEQAALVADAPPLESFLHHMLEVNDLYDAEVASMDRAIGALREFLDAEGLAEDTLLLIASDHGEQLFEAPRYPEDVRRQANLGKGKHAVCYLDYGHGTSFREESWRTPLIAVGPGFDAGRRVERMTANLDLFPTILDHLGVSHPPGLAGFSLTAPEPPPRDYVFGYTKEVFAIKDAEGRKYVDRTARMPIYRARERDPALDGEPVELFDLSHGEDENLAPTTPQGTSAFQRLLRGFRAKHDRDVDSTLTEKDLQALRELGYIEG